MKKKRFGNRFLITVILLSTSIFLLSWGVVGHRTVGRIAEKHLSQNAKAAVRDLLGSETLADVSTWADEVRNQPEYKPTGAWHYINLPLGLSYPGFRTQVEEMSLENLYSAIHKQEQVLADKTAPREKRIEALKFIVHFVGDLHQPMHVSRAEDKGGNTIQLNYNGSGTNLHSLWDTGLIESEGMDYQQLAEKYDHASAAQISQWQSDPLVKWLWESYEISSTLYAEVDAMRSRSIDERYYTAHIAIVRQRLEQAGIRLAGLLNAIFKDAPGGKGPAAGKGAANATAVKPAPGATERPAPGAPAQPATQIIDVHDAANHIDEYATVCGAVRGYKALDGLTLVNLGAPYPDQLLTVVLKGAAKDAYNSIDGKTICATGKIVLYKGKPEIVITDPKLLVLKVE